MKLPHSPICDLLGGSIPIVLAGMGGVARAELVAAVTAAGGFGFLGMVREPPALIEREVAELRQRGHQRFGVNIIPAATDPALLEQQVAICIRLAVPVVCTFWDLDLAVIGRLREAGIVVVHQIGSVDEAIAAERAGVAVIIAQGREAGGHVRGVRPLCELLPEVVAAVNVPVLAAGGLGSGGDLVTAMSLGAAGIVLGTALMATEESFAHDAHKQALLTASAGDTVLTSSFHINWPINAPVRVLKSPVTAGALGDPHSPSRTVIGEEEGRPIYLFSTDSPLRSMTGDFAKMALYAGTGVGRITEVSRAGDRMAAIMAEAKTLLVDTPEAVEIIESSSPVCYAGEISGAYMGLLDAAELDSELRQLVRQLRNALRAALVPQDDAASQPPFADSTAELAGWALRLQQLAVQAGASDGPQALLEATGEHSLLHSVRALIPQVEDGHIRARLIRLRRFLEAQR